jgi:predicted nucleic acid-binding Zn ribbon protein
MPRRRLLAREQEDVLDKPCRADTVLGDILKRLGIASRVRETRAVVAWPEVVGPAAAARSRALSCRSGRLFVEVDNSPWMQELACLSGDIRERLNARLSGEVVEEIVLRASRGREPKEAGGDPPERKMKE